MTPETFPPYVRLRQSQEFRDVFKHGRRHVRAGFVVIIAPGQRTRARLGLAIAKRRVPRAVDRNRIKRIIRDSFRRIRNQLGPVDVVVLARKDTVLMSNSLLFSQLQSIWLDAVADDSRVEST